jgi:hypothetical protein
MKMFMAMYNREESMPQMRKIFVIRVFPERLVELEIVDVAIVINIRLNVRRLAIATHQHVGRFDWKVENF